MENLYFACDKCWHAMDYGQVHTQGNSTCPRCNVGILRELAVMNIPAPPIGVTLLCLLCAYCKPWGIFDSRTGVSVCAECRDTVRNAAAPAVSDSARRAAEDAAQEICALYGLQESQTIAGIIMRNAAVPADNDTESLLSKVTTIADIGSTEEFGDALERLKSIRQLIATTTKEDR